MSELIELKDTKFKRVIGIRTHTWGIQEEEQYNKLLQYFLPEEIFVILDATKKKNKVPEKIQAIYWDDVFLKENDLLFWKNESEDVGWLCGDYSYYAFRNKVNSEYYWLIEPDVYLNFDCLSDFFSVFEDKVEDALLPYYSKEYKDTNDWHIAMASITGSKETIHKCFFPLHRLSADAIDTCLTERQKMSKLWTEKGWFGRKSDPKDRLKFSNDEVFVATTLTVKNKNIVSIDHIMPEAFSEFFFKPFRTKPIKDREIFLNKIFHPVKDKIKLIDDCSNKIINDINKNQPHKELHPDSSDIDFISWGIAEKIREHIKSKLMLRNSLSILRSNLEIFSKKIDLDSDVRLKIWVFDGRILVVEAFYKEQSFTLDINIENNDMKCKLFNRQGDFSFPEDALKTKPEFIKLINIKRENKKAYDFFLGKDKPMTEIEELIKEIFVWFYGNIKFIQY